MTELKDLVGVRILDAVERSEKTILHYGEETKVETFCFRLDGVVYCAREDPSDGYRSSMESLEVEDHPMSNAFPPVRVLCRMRPDGEDGKNDILELLDLGSGLVVLAVGTMHYDDWYPCFVAEWHPESLAVNK